MSYPHKNNKTSVIGCSLVLICATLFFSSSTAFASDPVATVAHHKANFSDYSVAAIQGDKNAQFRLGECYHRGTGTDSNQVSAWIWLTLSAEGESPVREEALALREVVTPLLTTHQKEYARLLLANIRTLVKE